MANRKNTEKKEWRTLYNNKIKNEQGVGTILNKKLLLIGIFLLILSINTTATWYIVGTEPGTTVTVNGDFEIPDFSYASGDCLAGFCSIPNAGTPFTITRTNGQKHLNSYSASATGGAGDNRQLFIYEKESIYDFNYSFWYYASTGSNLEYGFIDDTNTFTYKGGMTSADSWNFYSVNVPAGKRPAVNFIAGGVPVYLDEFKIDFNIFVIADINISDITIDLNTQAGTTEQTIDLNNFSQYTATPSFYQWDLNGTNISDTNNTQYTFTNAQTGDWNICLITGQDSNSSIDQNCETVTITDTINTELTTSIAQEMDTVNGINYATIQAKGTGTTQMDLYTFYINGIQFGQTTIKDEIKTTDINSTGDQNITMIAQINGFVYQEEETLTITDTNHTLRIDFNQTYTKGYIFYPEGSSTPGYDFNTGTETFIEINLTGFEEGGLATWFYGTEDLNQAYEFYNDFTDTNVNLYRYDVIEGAINILVNAKGGQPLGSNSENKTIIKIERFNAITDAWETTNQKFTEPNGTQIFHTDLNFTKITITREGYQTLTRVINPSEWIDSGAYIEFNMLPEGFYIWERIIWVMSNPLPGWLTTDQNRIIVFVHTDGGLGINYILYKNEIITEQQSNAIGIRDGNFTFTTDSNSNYTLEIYVNDSLRETLKWRYLDEVSSSALTQPTTDEDKTAVSLILFFMIIIITAIIKAIIPYTTETFFLLSILAGIIMPYPYAIIALIGAIYFSRTIITGFFK